jgi:hypothetical protein
MKTLNWEMLNDNFNTSMPSFIHYNMITLVWCHPVWSTTVVCTYITIIITNFVVLKIKVPVSADTLKMQDWTINSYEMHIQYIFERLTLPPQTEKSQTKQVTLRSCVSIVCKKEPLVKIFLQFSFQIFSWHNIVQLKWYHSSFSFGWYSFAICWISPEDNSIWHDRMEISKVN